MASHQQPPRQRNRGVGGTAGRTRRSGPLVVLAVLSLFSGLIATAGTVASAPSAEAAFADGGAGKYHESIDWFEWGADKETIPGTGITRTNTRAIAGHELATTCSLSNIDGVLAAYTPGSWQGDGLDDLYNIGGTGGANRLVIGLANQTQGSKVSFRFSCSVTLDGTPVPLQGLVVADAEQSATIGTDGTNVEYVQAKPEQPATWRIIDRYRAPGCENETIAEHSSDGTLRFRPEFYKTACTAGPTAVGFMEGATSAQVELQGGGRSAVALGVVLQTDFGDAPISYGEAGALLEPTWDGGTVPVGTTPLSGEGFTLASPGQSAPRLGETVDAESEYQASSDAMGDDRSGNEASDEDAIEPLGTVSVTPGGTYTLENVVCHGPGFVAGWIDWNGNGEFDPEERSTEIECQGGSVDLEWEVPADAVASLDRLSFLRLRIARDSAGVASPTGMSTSGEVEDHGLNIEIPRLEVAKTSDMTPDSRPGDTITYTVTATNASGAPFTEDYPAVVFDDLSGALDDASYNNDLTADVVPEGASYEEPLVSWMGALGIDETVTLTYSTTLGADNDESDRVVRNIAWVPEDPMNEDPPADCVPGTCATTEGLLPLLTVAKEADTDAVSTPGDIVEYTVKVTNHGPGVYSDTAPATAIDDLRGVSDDAEYRGDATADKGSVVEDSEGNLRWTGALGSGETATITYSVTYQGGGDNLLENRVCIPESHVEAGEEPCADVTVPASVLHQWKTVEAPEPTIAGSAVTYTLHFENSGAASAAVDAVDYLTHVLDDAEVTVEPANTNGDLDVNRDSDVISIRGNVPAGETYTVEYTVQVKADGQRGDSDLVNFLRNGDEEPPTDPVCEPTVDDRPDCTSTPVDGSFLIEKRGQVLGNEGPIDGAGFAIFPDDGGTAAEDPVVSEVEETAATGVFRVDGLATGDYWLREVRAPEGHMLLASDVPFEVMPSGEVALTGAAGSIRVEDDGSGTWTIIVVDLEAFELPLTGGSGSSPWILSGVLLASVALMVPALRGRDRRTYAVRV